MNDKVAHAGRRATAAALAAAVALACGASGLWLALHHPLWPWAAPALFVALAAACAAWPAAWPLALPAVLPLIGLAPWTGWITFEEWDLLVLAIATGGYLRRAATGRLAGPAAGGSPLVGLVLALLAASVLISLARGFADAGGFSFGLFQGYREPMNSLRPAKSLFAALLLWPLWKDLHHPNPERASRQLAAGLTLGLLAAALAALWERLAFTGLLNFSSDYRTTALFWEMHVGGAALDGFLALTVPFALREILVAPAGRRAIGLAPVLALAAYACLTTFSRGVYLAVPVGVAVMLAVHATQAGPVSRGARGGLLVQLLPALLLTTAFGAAAMLMFPSSGYRGMLALLGAACLLLPLPGVLRHAARSVLVLGVTLGGVLCAAAWGATQWLPKGTYIAYGAAWGLTLLALLRAQGGPATAPRSALPPALALAGFLALAVGMVLVARHWGGPAAGQAAWPALAGLLLLLPLSLATPQPPWPAQPRWWGATAGAMALAAGVVATFGGGAYMSERFTTSGSDLGGRLQHWRDGLAELHGPADLLLGRGLGRYVDVLAFAAPRDNVPGDYRLHGEAGQPVLTLVAGTHMIGWGEMQRLSQRIVLPVAPVSARLKVRADKQTQFHVEICLKHLLYDNGCLIKQFDVPAQPGVWQTVEAALEGAPLTQPAWYAPRLVMLSMGVANPGQRLDVAGVELRGADGANLLANGDFAAGLARWFMTSDRNHMPWHIKNMAMHQLFDQGLLGLLLLTAVVCGALARVTLGAARSHPLAPGIAGGLAGFLVVGLFDSLLDVPRVAFLFYFVVLLGLYLRPPRVRSPGTPAAPPH